MNRHHVAHYFAEVVLVLALIGACWWIAREQGEVDSVARTHGYFGFSEGAPR